MNKAELVTAVSEKTAITKTDVEKILNAIISTIKETVQSGESIKLLGFGTFTQINKKACKRYNIHTGKQQNIPAKKVPKFIAGTEFKNLINTKIKKK